MKTINHNYPFKILLLFLVLPTMLSAQEFGWVNRTWAAPVWPIYSMDVDKNGYTYLTGLIGFNQEDYVDGYSIVDPEYYDSSSFVAKYDPDGNIEWLFSFGGRGRAIVVDDLGNCYVSGIHYDEEILVGDFELADWGWDNGFLFMLDSNGKLQWLIESKTWGNDAYSGRAVAIKDGGCYWFAGGYYPLTINGVEYDGPEETGFYLFRIDVNGNMEWNLKGKAISGTRNIVDQEENLYFAHAFIDSTSIGGIDLSSGGAWDIVISKCDKEGQILWRRLISGPSYERIMDLDVDQSGNVYFAMHSESNQVVIQDIEYPNNSEGILFGKLNKEGGLEWLHLQAKDSIIYDNRCLINVLDEETVVAVSGELRQTYTGYMIPAHGGLRIQALQQSDGGITYDSLHIKWRVGKDMGMDQHHNLFGYDYYHESITVNNTLLTASYYGGFLVRYSNIVPVEESESFQKTQCLNLFPNPTSDYISLPQTSTEDTWVLYQIYNSMGFIIQEGSYLLGSKLNIQSLGKGFYTLSIDQLNDDPRNFTFIKVE